MASVKPEDYTQTGKPKLISNSPPNTPTSATGWNLSQSFRGYRFLEDSEGDIIAFPVMLTDTQGNNPLNIVNPSADAVSAAAGATRVIGVEAFAYQFNGASWDRRRGNSSLYNVSDASTTNFTGGSINTYNARTVIIQLLVATFTGTSWTPEIDYRDGTGSWRPLWVAATARTGAKNDIIILGPGGAAAVGTAGVGASTGYAGYSTTDSATANNLIIVPFAFGPNIRVVITKSAASTFSANFEVDGGND